MTQDWTADASVLPSAEPPPALEGGYPKGNHEQPKHSLLKVGPTS
jgi:hypothetical protein